MINVGLIGCGYWGPNLIRNFEEISNSDLLMCCDLSEERLVNIKSRFKGIEVVKDYRELLANPEIDAVAVATPIHTHFNIVQDVLLSKKHVLVEKPIATSIMESEKLIEISKNQNKVLMVGHTFLFNSAVRYLKQIINDGSLGNIYYINSVRVNLGLFQEESNVIWDLAPHDLSILLHLLDKEPVKVNAFSKSNINMNTEDVAFITLWFPNEIMATIHISWLAPLKERYTTVIGSEKMVVYDDVEQLEKIKIYDKSVKYHSTYDTFGEFNLSYRYGDTQIPRLELTEPLKIECEHFIDCIEKKTTCISDGVFALKVVKCLTAIQESIENNGKIVEIK